VSIAGVIFDLDGVLVDSESLWDDVRRELTGELGGTGRAEAQQQMMGMSSPEWSAYMHEELGVPLPPGEISERVVAEMAARYRSRLPLIEGGVDAVRRMAGHRPVGIASSANRPLIDLFLEETALVEVVSVSVSSEEVAAGKPAPDVYLRAAELMGLDPRSCAAVEDSSNGLRSAAAAGMRVIAVPNPHYPPTGDALALADVVLGSIEELTGEVVSPG
jgi:beta-phosphoglucomutase-like phosphatase (HAD superfamily)